LVEELRGSPLRVILDDRPDFLVRAVSEWLVVD
jgi:hypothetical protein